jgi:hypothetical protein
MRVKPTPRAAAFAALVVVASPCAAPAQQRDAPPDAGAALEEWASQTQRMLEAMRDAARPWTDALSAYLQNPDSFHPPETLPNGDIVIRRRAPGDAPSPDAPLPDAPTLPGADDDPLDL